MQYERVKGFFADIEKENWKVAVGGTNPDGPGYFITPTIIDRPKEDSRIVTEEPFGESVYPAQEAESPHAQNAPKIERNIDRKPQVRSYHSSRSRPKKRRSGKPTTRRWVSEHRCGPGMWTVRIALPRRSKQARSGSTRTSNSIPACRSAATSKAVTEVTNGVFRAWFRSVTARRFS